MSTATPTSNPTNSRRTILWLVVGHIVIGLTAYASLHISGPFDNMCERAFVGIVFSEASLLGIWGSLGTANWWRRLAGVILGVSYLTILFAVPTRTGFTEINIVIVLGVVVTTLFVAISLSTIRPFDFVIWLVPPQDASADRITFSIRHLLGFTLLIACLVTIGKTIQPSVHFNPLLWIAIVIPLIGGIVGVIPVWFVLATRQPALPSVGVVAAGAFVGYCLGGIIESIGGVWMMTVTATEALSVAVSLLIVRSCGYRLMRMPNGTAT